MDFIFGPETEAFRAEAREWLTAHPDRTPGREWERELGAAGWIGLGWPRPHGKAAPLLRQVLFHEEYARARAPGRIGHIGEYLLGATIAALGTDDQRRRFLPSIARGEEQWCQGYSEPNAGSDLAGVQTRAELSGKQWRINGQKIWTSHAQVADWCFVVCRTDPKAARHAGLSYLLVPMRQGGVTVRPIRQLTGTSEFCEVFFEDVRTPAENVVGEIGDGWRVAMATLAFERGASTLGQQIGFANELAMIVDAAKRTGAARDPRLRDRLAQAKIELDVMRWNALRVLSHGAAGELPREALMTKLYWASWHKRLGELAMDVLGPEAELAVAPPYELSPLQEMFLFSRADTIYAGSNEIQKNIIATRALGLPREPGSR
jgi:alkylation response protein AidB-like acyl-CoA dehydrogenase